MRPSRFVPHLAVAVSIALPLAGLGVQAANAAPRAKTSKTTKTTSTVTPTWSEDLLSGDTAAPTAGPGAWTPTNALLAVTAPGTLAVTTLGDPTAVTNVALQQGSGPAAWTPVTPGQVLTGTGTFRALATGRAVQASLSWYDAAGAKVAGAAVGGKTLTDSATAATTVRVVGLAPAGAAYASLGFVVWRTPGTEVHNFSSPSLVVSNGRTPLAGPFTVKGNRIYDVNGKPVVFRGIGREGLELASAPADLTHYDVNMIRAWGANVVRLPLGSQYWLASDCHYDPTYVQRVDQVVRWINAAGMLALVDLHTNDPTSCGTPGRHPMADYAGATTFWKEAATHFKDWPLVAFELYNEPNHISDQVWRYGGTVTAQDGTVYRAAGMQDLYGAVRSTGAKNLVFATTQMYGTQWPTTAPLAGSNIVYGIHPYVCGRPQDCTTDDPSYITRFVTPGKSYPIMLTEFGWPDGRDDSYLDKTIGYAERYGWGWSVWKWDTGGQCLDANWFGLVHTGTCGAGRPYEPSPGGMRVLSGLQQN